MCLKGTNIMKKLLGMLLCWLMLVGLMSLTAFAEGNFIVSGVFMVAAVTVKCKIFR